MHSLFQAARLKQTYVLAGASAGGILVRRYQQDYPREAGGLVFVDSAQEEWRMAAISKQLDPNWTHPGFLKENGFLPDQQKLTWHADIPLIVLERTEKPPCSAFPGLTQKQCGVVVQDEAPPAATLRLMVWDIHCDHSVESTHDRNDHSSHFAMLSFCQGERILIFPSAAFPTKFQSRLATKPGLTAKP